MNKSLLHLKLWLTKIIIIKKNIFFHLHIFSRITTDAVYFLPCWSYLSIIHFWWSTCLKGYSTQIFSHHLLTIMPFQMIFFLQISAKVFRKIIHLCEFTYKGPTKLMLQKACKANSMVNHTTPVDEHEGEQMMREFSFLCGYFFFFFFLSFSRRFCPKRLTNEDNRSNQNQQKSNNMHVLWQVLVSLTQYT